MNYPKLTISTLGDVVNDLKNNIETSFISNITVISNVDLLLTFSHYRKEKLLISLNHRSPFLSLIETNESLQTLLGGFSDMLRREIKDSKILDISILGNDRIIQFELSKTNELFEKETKYLIIELIPHKPNLIILDGERKILYATHYTDLLADRPIMQRIFYSTPESNLVKAVESLDYETYKSNAKAYLKEAKINRQKVKNKELVDFVNKRIRILKNKIKNIEKDIEAAKEMLVYKDYGDMCLTYANDEDGLLDAIKEGFIKDYDSSISVNENAQRYYRYFKKSKSTINHGEEEIKKAKEEIEYFEHIKIQIENGSDEDLNEIKTLLLKKQDNTKKVKVSKFNPYYIIYDNTKIVFGKSDFQNDELTFNKAKPNYHFFHIKNYPGAHVVIFNEYPSEDHILIACEICLILSKKESGDISTTLIKHVRKGRKIGQVILRQYDNIYLNNVRDTTKRLLELAIRL